MHAKQRNLQRKREKNRQKLILKWLVLKNEKGGAAWHFSAPKIKGRLALIFPDVKRRFITDLRKKREFCRIRISKFEKLCIIFQWTHKNVSDKGKRYFFSLKGLIENCVCFYVIEKSHQDRSF